MGLGSVTNVTGLCDECRLGSVAGPPPERSTAREELARCESVTGPSPERPGASWPGMTFTPDIQADRARDDFHARRSARPGPG
jgi:hypothetical protein